MASLADAVADVADGATVMIGGFGTAGLPNELVGALLAQGAKDLTIVNNNAGNGDTGLAALIVGLQPVLTAFWLAGVGAAEESGTQIEGGDCRTDLSSQPLLQRIVSPGRRR